MKGTCKECAHFDPKHNLCRERPPGQYSAGGGAIVSFLWPEVMPEDWCGKFSTKDDVRDIRDMFDVMLTVIKNGLP